MVGSKIGREVVMKTGKLFIVLFLGLTCVGAAKIAIDHGVVDSIDELEVLFREQQDLIHPGSPRAEDISVYSHETVIPIRWSNFPRKFTKYMYAMMDVHGFPIYRISIYEDPGSRETVFLNSYGTEVYRRVPEANYNLNRLLKTIPPASDASTPRVLHQGFFDPADVAAEFSFIPETLYSDYLELQEETTALEAVMTALQHPVTNLHVTLRAAANGAVELEIEWPSFFTNDLDIFATLDLAGHVWQVVTSNIPTHNTDHYRWTDWAATNTPQRFYIVGNANLDSDGDGVADGLETYIYGSDPDEQDSDSDGVDDGVEVGASPPTDPLNGDTQAPVVSITLPVNNIVVVP